MASKKERGSRKRRRVGTMIANAIVKGIQFLTRGRHKNKGYNSD